MIAGAAEGLGEAFAISLASRGMNLLLCDQQDSKLYALQEKLISQYNIEVETIILNLANPDSSSKLMEAMHRLDCGFLIYNAAYGPVIKFKDCSSDDIDTIINVNINTPTQLIRTWLLQRKEKPTGILLVSSFAGFRGTNYIIPYAASKAYLWNFTEGLHYEFRGSPFTFGVCCPGAVATPNYIKTKPNAFWLSPKPAKPSEVAEYTIHKFGKKVFIMPGRLNRISHFLMSRVLPRSWATGLHNFVMRRMYEPLRSGSNGE